MAKQSAAKLDRCISCAKNGNGMMNGNGNGSGNGSRNHVKREREVRASGEGKVRR
jgi:hypothetical protein